MTHLVGVRLRNWTVFRGEHELTLGPGCYAVTAESDLDRRRSNYLGKSSFLAAIRWALEGGMLKGSRVRLVDSIDEWITRGEDEMTVDLEFDDGAFVSRSKRRGASGQLEVQVAGRVLEGDDAQAELERMLGLPAEERLSTCWAEQDDLARLVDARPSEVTETVEGWLRLDKLWEAGEAVVVRLNQASAELEAKLVEHAAAVRNADPSELARYERELKDEERRLIKAVSEYERVMREREGFARRRLVRQEVWELAAKQLSLEELLKGEAREVGEDEPVDLVAATSEREKARSVYGQRTAEVRRLAALVEGEFDGVCPVLEGFTCPARKEISAHRGDFTRQLATAQRDQEAAGLDLKLTSENLGKVEKLAKARATAKLLEERRKFALEQVKADIGQLEAKLMEARRLGIVPTEAGEDPPELPPYPDGRRVDALRAELQIRREAVAALPELAREVEEMRDAVRAIRVALFVLGPEGARRRAAERAVAVIERDATRRLAESGIELQVRAAWGRETKELADQCRECGSAFPASARVKSCARCGAVRGPKVRHEFRFRPSHVSGAGRDLAGLALRCAAFDWVRRERGTSWAIGVFDEPTGKLDAAHLPLVSAGIRRLLAGTFEQAFVTSHQPGVLDACDRRVVVRSDGKWSRLELGA